MACVNKKDNFPKTNLMFSLAESNIIRKPARYVAPNLIEGEKAVIHILQPKQKFINLKFSENTTINKYKPKLIIDSGYNLDSHKTIKEKVKRIEKTIVSKGEVYTCYTYLLTTKDNELYLVSIAMESTALGFEVVESIAEELEIPVLKPAWSGIYTSNAIAVFLDDIFIQKK